MGATPVQFLDLDNPLAQAGMTEAKARALADKEALADKVREEQGKAKYKIELMLSGDRSAMKPSAGVLTFWESGSKLHGGGDAVMHICPGKHLKRSDCEAFIPDSGHAMGFLVCPRCFTRWEGEQVHGQLLFRLSFKGWATVLHKYYMKLGGNADLVVKSVPLDLRGASAREQARQQGGELLGRVRGKRNTLVYPLAHIIKDTAAGAGLYERILAFVREA